MLIPGYSSTPDQLAGLASAIEAAGRTTMVFSPAENGTGDLATEAQAVAVAAKQLLAQTNSATLDVVGYSAGGVVARAMVRDYGGGAYVRRVITLGSPQHGTQPDSFGYTDASQCPDLACSQMMAGSSFITALNSGTETPAGPTWVEIWSETDGVVNPPSSAILNGATNIDIQGICPEANIPHQSLPDAPLPQNIVLAELVEGAPPTLSTSDCGRLNP